MNVAQTEPSIRLKHLQGNDLLREEVDNVFRHIDTLEWRLVDKDWIALEAHAAAETEINELLRGV